MNPAMFGLLALFVQAASPSTDLEAKADAQALLSEGAQLFEGGAMAEALEKFAQAYIGQDSRNLGRAVEAMKFNSLNNSCGSGGTGQGCSDSGINSVTWRRDVGNVFWRLSAVSAAATGVLFIEEGRTVSVTPMAGKTMGLIARVGC